MFEHITYMNKCTNTSSTTRPQGRHASPLRASVGSLVCPAKNAFPPPNLRSTFLSKLSWNSASSPGSLPLSHRSDHCFLSTRGALSLYNSHVALSLSPAYSLSPLRRALGQPVCSGHYTHRVFKTPSPVRLPLLLLAWSYRQWFEV